MSKVGLLKDVTLDQLTNAIREVAAGGTAVQPGIAARIVEGLGRLGAEIPSLDPQGVIGQGPLGAISDT